VRRSWTYAATAWPIVREPNTFLRPLGSPRIVQPKLTMPTDARFASAEDMVSMFCDDCERLLGVWATPFMKATGSRETNGRRQFLRLMVYVGL
jgi:hypothetical protein